MSAKQDESHYDDEKEIIQKQLKIEREDLMSMCEQHQVLSIICELSVDLVQLEVHDILNTLLVCTSH